MCSLLGRIRSWSNVFGCGSPRGIQPARQSSRPSPQHGKAFHQSSCRNNGTTATGHPHRRMHGYMRESCPTPCTFEPWKHMPPIMPSRSSSWWAEISCQRSVGRVALNGRFRPAPRSRARASQRATCGAAAHQVVSRQSCASYALAPQTTSLAIFPLGSGSGPCSSTDTLSPPTTPNGT